jgi:hypothetical protein
LLVAGFEDGSFPKIDVFPHLYPCDIGKLKQIAVDAVFFPVAPEQNGDDAAYDKDIFGVEALDKR